MRSFERALATPHSPSLSVAATPERLREVRALVRTVAARHSLTVDGLADLVLAVDEGGRLLVGGSRVERDGSFFEPALLIDVPLSARIAREEIFGPVAVVYRVDSDEDALSAANDTEFGLVGYVFSKTQALAYAERLETGMVGVNRGLVSDPAGAFGGIKASGLGREGGTSGIHEYLETKYMAVEV